MAQRSFNTEPGWYHEARQAFVPDLARGMRACVFLDWSRCFVLASLKGAALEFASALQKIHFDQSRMVLTTNEVTR